MTAPQPLTRIIMEINERLEKLESRIEYLVRLLEEKALNRSGAGSDLELRPKLESIISGLPKGRVPMRVLASMAGLPFGKQSSQAVGRIMDAMGFQRYATAKDRGFIIR